MLTHRLSALFSRRDKPYDATALAAGGYRLPRRMTSNASLLAPLISILIFVMVITAIVWSLNRREQQYQQDTLYRNAAWAQQQIRVALGDVQDQGAALARAAAAGSPQIGAALAQAHRHHPEVVLVDWLDTDGRSMTASVRSEAEQATEGTASGTRPASAPVPASQARSASQSGDAGLPTIPANLPQWQTMLRAGAGGPASQHYSPLLFDAAGKAYMTLQTPVVRARRQIGSIAMLLSIDAMLAHQLPSELTSKFKISLVAEDGRELSTSSTRPRLPRDAFSQLRLQPPGNGLSVRVYTYPRIGNLTNNTLVWLVAGLSCLVLWSLLSLWKFTRQRAAVQQALFEEASFRRAMENSVSLGMRVLDLTGRITHVNPAFCRMTGWDESDLVGQVAPFAYWPPDSYAEMARQYDMTLRGKVPASGFEMRVRRKDGSIFHARMYISPLIDASGKQTGWMGSMTDISEPRRVREELSAAHERFTTVLESLDAAVSVLAANEAELLFANRYYRNLFGVRADGHLALAGTGFDMTQVSNDSIDLVDTYAGLPASALTDSSADTIEVYVERAAKWFEVRRQYIQWVDGHVAQMQIATDITARKQAQELARQQEEKLQFTSRLTTMGEMASSLAHELNQPLAAISNYCSGAAALVKSGRGSDATLLQALDKTAQQALRAGMIIKRIRAFVKRSEPKREPADVHDIVADAVGLAEIEVRRLGMRVAIDAGSPLPAVSVDPVLIEQVLVNLIKNAAEAMYGAPRQNDPERSTIHVCASREDEMICVTVRDTGPGIDPAHAEQLFEPFFSTKRDGMGMGLNICRSIIESHRGRLWAENRQDAAGQVLGCEFHFTLPIGEAPSARYDS
ncbi:PAS domain-containing sensor histidine kinase [Chitinasiproducens palmae]